MVPRTEYVNISWILKPCKTRCFQRPYIRFLHPTSCFRTMYNKMLPKDQTDFTWCVKIRVFIESTCFDRSCRVAEKVAFYKLQSEYYYNLSKEMEQEVASKYLKNIDE